MRVTGGLRKYSTEVEEGEVSEMCMWFWLVRLKQRTEPAFSL